MILPDLIRTRAAQAPSAPALIFRDTKITYGELQERIERCASGLAALGVKKGDTFALLLRNCPEFLILAMALSKIGAAVVPINFLEKAERVALILNDAKAVGALTAREFAATIESASAQVPTLRHFFVRDGEKGRFKDFATLLTAARRTEPDLAAEDDIMMLLYTSGTTGLPKGVMLTHRNFLANVEQCLEAIDVTPRDRFLCLLPLFHSFSWTTCLVIPLKLGTSTVIVESLLPFDPVIQAIWRHKVTLFVAVPQIYAALTTRIKGFRAFAVRWLNPVRLCISGAAPMPAHVHRRFESSFKVPLLEGYGLTETSPVATLNPERKRKVGTVGLPLPGVQVELRGDDGKVVAAGEVGEIWIRGDNVMKGYYGRPTETAEALTPDGFLKTGDLARWDEEGYLVIVDRKKDLIIVKGLNVYPQEVENVLSQDPNVKECAVVGKTDPETGEEAVRAFVTAKEGATVDKASLFALCREHLAAYKRPRDIVVIDEMPKNALQKILKKDLRARP